MLKNGIDDCEIIIAEEGDKEDVFAHIADKWYRLTCSESPFEDHTHQVSFEEMSSEEQLAEANKYYEEHIAKRHIEQSNSKKFN